MDGQALLRPGGAGLDAAGGGSVGGQAKVTGAALWEAHRNGSQAARTDLIHRFEPLVRATLSRQLGRAPDRFHEDLLGAGRLALVKAIDSYDPAKGVKFESYAITLIRGAMLEFLRRDDWCPRGVRAAQKRGEPVEALRQVSLETILYEGDSEDLTLLRTLSDREDTPDRRVPERLEARVVRVLVECLPRRERRVVELYYWEEETFHRIAERIGQSESTAKNLHDGALRHLRLWLEDREPGYAGR